MYAYPPPPPPYAMLESNQQYYANGPSAYHRNVPQYPSKYRKSSFAATCCRCICGCCCFFFLIIVIIVLILFAFYHVYDPKIPNYRVEGISVKAFDILPDSSLNSEFALSVRAQNPNKHIGIVYGDASWVTVSYMDTTLCNGKVPSFHQREENTTVITVDLKGKSEFGSGLQQNLTDNVKSHRIPLVVRLKVPVNIVLGEIPLRELKVFVNCTMVLDNLAPNSNVGIISKDTSVGIEL
ncbi:hypothetical protein DH2020_022893 [Rehmannia glutinosa]|uniref:Late embryogenesis abundant protein LEA-2 subgroup domain-containing protein n=1 Tax=Rehmannia glutinosa TaxID=99300 RepID=A0ABR0W8U4_REHGL